MTNLEMIANLINAHLETLGMDRDLHAKAIESEDATVITVRDDDTEVAYVRRTTRTIPTISGPKEMPGWEIHLWEPYSNPPGWIDHYQSTVGSIVSAATDCVLALIKESLYHDAAEYLKQQKLAEFGE